MIHPNQVLSKFNEGMNTAEIAEEFDISEGTAYRLLSQARVDLRTELPPSTPVLHRGTILGAVAEIAETRIDELLGLRKVAYLVRARRVAIEIFKEFRPDMSRSSVARVLKRDLATILHAERSTLLDESLMRQVTERLKALSPQSNPSAFVSIYLDSTPSRSMSA